MTVHPCHAFRASISEHLNSQGVIDLNQCVAPRGWMQGDRTVPVRKGPYSLSMDGSWTIASKSICSPDIPDHSKVEEDQKLNGPHASLDAVDSTRVCNAALT